MDSQRFNDLYCTAQRTLHTLQGELDQLTTQSDAERLQQEAAALCATVRRLERCLRMQQAALHTPPSQLQQLADRLTSDIERLIPIEVVARRQAHHVLPGLPKHVLAVESLARCHVSAAIERWFNPVDERQQLAAQLAPPPQHKPQTGMFAWLRRTLFGQPKPENSLPSLHFLTRSEAQDALLSMRIGLHQIIGRSDEQLHDTLSVTLTEFQQHMRDHVLPGVSSLFDELAQRLAAAGLALTRDIPQPALLDLRYPHRAQQTQTTAYPGATRHWHSPAWEQRYSWCTTADDAPDSPPAPADGFQIHGRDIESLAMQEIDTLFAAFRQTVELNIQAPLNQGVVSYFRALRQTITDTQSDLKAALEDLQQLGLMDEEPTSIDDSRRQVTALLADAEHLQRALDQQPANHEGVGAD